MHTHQHTHAYTWALHTHTQTQAYTHTHTHTHTRTHARTHGRTHACTDARTHGRTQHTYILYWQVVLAYGSLIIESETELCCVECGPYPTELICDGTAVALSKSNVDPAIRSWLNDESPHSTGMHTVSLFIFYERNLIIKYVRDVYLLKCILQKLWKYRCFTKTHHTLIENRTILDKNRTILEKNRTM
jgi:hypothetical protein